MPSKNGLHGFQIIKWSLTKFLWLQVSTKLGMWSSIILEPRLFTSHCKH